MDVDNTYFSYISKRSVLKANDLGSLVVFLVGLSRMCYFSVLF